MTDVKMNYDFSKSFREGEEEKGRRKKYDGQGDVGVDLGALTRSLCELGHFLNTVTGCIPEERLQRALHGAGRLLGSNYSSTKIQLISSDFSLTCHSNKIYQSVSFVISGRHCKTSSKDLN